MKILVIGAAGKTGAAFVEQALVAGHQITAFVHNAAEYTQPNVRVIAGDATDPAKINEAVAGQDAVVDTLGGKTPYKDTTLETDTARTVLTAMRSHAVRRFLVISVLGEGESRANASFVYQHLLMPTFLRGAMKDKAAMESEVAASDLDWTIVRPPILTDDAPTGNIRVYEATEGDTAHKITRADVAKFLLDQLTSPQYFHQAITIANV